jgi:hypothetical protein
VKTIRFLVVAVLAAAGALLGITLAASGASAQPTPTPYPPSGGNCAIVSVGQTTAHPGDSILVTGTQFSAGEHLTLSLQPLGATVGHVTTSASGTF